MKNLAKKAFVFAGILLMAILFYFIFTHRPSKNNTVVYTTIAEPELPVIYTEVLGYEMNVLHGYKQEMNSSVLRESLTILPEDRKLKLDIEKYTKKPLSVNYEIRSINNEQLIEKTEIDKESYEIIENQGMSVTLPIQNLITENREYMLHIYLETEDFGMLHYYTRIMMADNSKIKDMAAFAKDFSEKTLNYEAAKELTTYLETNDKEDNSSLGKVTIRSSFSQLTWAGLQMTLKGEPQIRVREVDGVMSNIDVCYVLGRENTNGITELYEVTDNYTLRWNERRIYMMEFNRETNHIFDGNQEDFSGKRILLGITNDNMISTKKSENGRYTAFVINRDLWCFDQNGGGHAVRVYSFRSAVDSGVRSNYDQHDIKILSVSDEGDIDFAVYGYMNRGKREGENGISINRYNATDKAINEKVFILSENAFDLLKTQVDILAYQNQSEMFYVMIDSAIYGIDLSTGEYFTVAEAVADGTYAVNHNQSKIAWQEGENRYSAPVINMLNLETGEKKSISADGEDSLSVLGFVNDDFVYGKSHKSDQWMLHGRLKTVPMYALDIVNDNLEKEAHYEKDGKYLTDVYVEDGRVRISRLSKTGENQYRYLDEDTIVCNTEIENDKLAGISWYASEEKRKVYFVKLDNEIHSSKSVKVSAPKKISEESLKELKLKPNKNIQGMLFYAYGGGRLLGISQELGKAVAMAYQEMGFVTDANQIIIWNRIGRPASINIKEAKTAVFPIVQSIQDEKIGVNQGSVTAYDARGCTLNQVLYYVGKGCPVVAYGPDENMIILTGYDQYNISCMDLTSGETWKMGLGDAGEYFQNAYNDFICGIGLPQ